jgi:HK97 gp10 family phage protein
MANEVRFSLKNQLPNITKMLPREFENAILKSAILLNNEVKRVLSGTRHGKMYKIPATNRMYQASSPSEAPASRLGHLRNSYQYKVKGNGFNSAGYVGSPLDYSHYLEYGTAHMRPRRHLSVAFKKAKPQVLEQFRSLLQ